MGLRTIRGGLLFGAGIATTNVILQFAVTPFLPWQVVGALNLAAWVSGVAAAGVYAGRQSLSAAAGAGVIAATVDAARALAIGLMVGTPAVPQMGELHATVTPGLLVAGTVVELMVVAPLAAAVGLVSARVLLRRSPAPGV